MKPSAIMLLHCPDQPGIISDVTNFITVNKGNIVYLDQYVDRVDGIFFMRIEWELEEFTIPREKIKEFVETLYGQRYDMHFSLYFSDQRPRMAIFVSKMRHCLYDLLARFKAGSSPATFPVSSATTKICDMCLNSSAFHILYGASRRTTRTRARWRQRRWNCSENITSRSSCLPAICKSSVKK